MTAVTHHSSAWNERRERRHYARTDLLVGFPALLAVALVTRVVFELPASYLLPAVAFYAANAVLVFTMVLVALPGPGLSAANRVTLARATGQLPVPVLVRQPDIHHANGLLEDHRRLDLRHGDRWPR